MTTETTNDSTVIDINLEEDPELSYFTWKVQVEDVASNAATTVEPTGPLPSSSGCPVQGLTI